MRPYVDVRSSGWPLFINGLFVTELVGSSRDISLEGATLIATTLSKRKREDEQVIPIAPNLYKST